MLHILLWDWQHLSFYRHMWLPKTHITTKTTFALNVRTRGFSTRLRTHYLFRGDGQHSFGHLFIQHLYIFTRLRYYFFFDLWLRKSLLTSYCFFSIHPDQLFIYLPIVYTLYMLNYIYFWKFTFCHYSQLDTNCIFLKVSRHYETNRKATCINQCRIFCLLCHPCSRWNDRA